MLNNWFKPYPRLYIDIYRTDEGKYNYYILVKPGFFGSKQYLSFYKYEHLDHPNYYIFSLWEYRSCGNEMSTLEEAQTIAKVYKAWYIEDQERQKRKKEEQIKLEKEKRKKQNKLNLALLNA